MRMAFPKFTAVHMLARMVMLSTLGLITTVSAALSHEVRPAIADVTLSPESIEIEVRLTAETLLAGIDMQGITDTNEAPEAEVYDQFRALSADELAEQFRSNWAELESGFIAEAGDTRVSLSLDDVMVADPGDAELPRDTTIRLSAALPEDDSAVRVGWAAENGSIIIRQSGGGDDAYADNLSGGALSDPLPRIGAVTESALNVFVRYIGVGFDHIIPKGLDHILFVLGLFFLSLKLRPLITQVTVFTVAHTITLALASLGYISVNPAIVEPLIAASIVYVAVENLFTSKVTWWRPVIIFGFGLLHGMGFASVLDEFGLAPGRFIAGLIGFNVGVEVGQLAVIGLALLLLWVAVQGARMKKLDPLEETVREHEVMYQGIAIPGSILIAIVGAYWTIERVFF